MGDGMKLYIPYSLISIAGIAISGNTIFIDPAYMEN